MLLQLIVNGLIAGSTYALVALGFTIIYRTVKFFHFAHGVDYTAGAYFAYTLAISLHLHPIPVFFGHWPDCPPGYRDREICLPSLKTT